MTPKTTLSSDMPSKKTALAPERATLQDATRLIEDLYLFMLQVPIGSLRIRNQSLYSKTRDFIALAKNKDAQSVQELFEDRAAHGHFFGEPVLPTPVGSLFPPAVEGVPMESSD
jgi:hypothetical protein